MWNKFISFCQSTKKLVPFFLRHDVVSSNNVRAGFDQLSVSLVYAMHCRPTLQHVQTHCRCGTPLDQRFSNFFDHGLLFSSGIVGGPPWAPHFRVATFALSQSGTGVRPFLPPFPLPPPSFPFPIPLEVDSLPQLGLEGLGERWSFPSGSGRSPAAKRILTHFRPKVLAPFWVSNAALFF